MDAAACLQEKGIQVRVLRLAVIEPLPLSQLREAMQGISRGIILEETCESSGIHEAISYGIADCKFTHIDLGKRFTTHGSVDKLYQLNGLDAKSVAAYIEEVCSVEN